MENLESNGRPTAAATSTARTETADADNGVNSAIPASEPLTVVLSGGKKVSGGKEEFQEEKDKVNNAPNEKPDVASRGEKKVLNVMEEEKLEDVSNKNENENRATMNVATSGDADDGVLVSKGEKAKEAEKIESTVKGREGKALAAGRKIDNTPKKANRRKRIKKNTTLRIKKNSALKDSGDAVASISRGEKTVSGTEKTGDDDEMKEKVGNTLNKANKRKKLKKLTQGGNGSTGSVVSGGDEKVVLEKEVVNTPKEPNKLKRKKSMLAESNDVNAILSGGGGKMEAEDGGKVESNPKKAKRRGRRGTKGKRENTTLRDAADAVAKDANKPETSTAGKASEGAESMGMIFMCNSKTKGDCYHYKVLGLPANKKEKVLKIYKGMRLFLFDIDMKLLHGIYKAAGPGGYNIEHKAFNSAFPSQVRFSILDDCAPLPVEKFKAAIKENFYGKNKFNCELTAEQVKNLCKLFRVTSKSSKPKQDGSVNRRDVPNSVDSSRKRRRDDDRVKLFELDGDRKRRRRDDDRVKRFELDGDRKRRRDDDRVKRFELDGDRNRRRNDDRVKRFELDGDRKRRRDHDRVKHSELDGDRFPASRVDVYERTAYAPQPLPPTLPRASYEREAYASTLPSHITPLLNVYGQPIQTGINRSDPQRGHHHNLLTYSSLRPQREIKYEDSNILYREPLAYRDPLYPAGVPPGYYRPSY